MDLSVIFRDIAHILIKLGMVVLLVITPMMFKDEITSTSVWHISGIMITQISWSILCDITMQDLPATNGEQIGTLILTSFAAPLAAYTQHMCVQQGGC